MKRNPREIEQTHRKLSRRALVVGGLQLGFVGALGMRMRYMQVDQADEFRLLAEENRVNIRLIAPSRGELFDRNGIPLARNVPSYRLVMVREDAGEQGERVLKVDVEQRGERLVRDARRLSTARRQLAVDLLGLGAERGEVGDRSRCSRGHRIIVRAACADRGRSRATS